MGLSVSPTVTKWWSWNQNIGLFCIKASALSTTVYYRKERITGPLMSLHSFSFQVRAKNSSAFSVDGDCSGEQCTPRDRGRAFITVVGQADPGNVHKEFKGQLNIALWAALFPLNRDKGLCLCSSPLPAILFSCPSFRVWLATSVTPKLTQFPPVQLPPASRPFTLQLTLETGQAGGDCYSVTY